MAIIDKPSDFFNTKLYTGNAGTNNITGVGFQPDWVWMKNRVSDYYHGLYDSVRGTGTSKSLNSNTNEAEGTNSSNLNLTSFNSDGFSLGSTSSTNVINTNSQNHVSWNWKAGTSFTNDASATGIGTIDSTGSVSQEAGFSIISYTGNGTANQSVAHGLGATPKFIIIKPRSASGYWCVTNPRFVSVSDPNIMYLQLTGAESDDTNINGTTAPSSTVFGVDDYGAVNTNNQTQIAYCFTPIQGYSAMGTYTGNGNADGAFVYTGFKPAWLMVKSTGSGGWIINDNKRSPHNITGLTLYPNSTASEESYTGGASEWDFLSNGFKNRDSGSAQNASGTSYIYMAFAENPFVASNFVPTTAR